MARRPVGIAERLTRLGAWRSLTTAGGARAVDLARRRGHLHLLSTLAVPEPGEHEQRKLATWDHRLAGLNTERIRSLDLVPSRPVSTEVIAVGRLDFPWFPYSGMDGGFGLSVHRDRLVAESWSRVVGGSGQGHVFIESGSVLVEQGSGPGSDPLLLILPDSPSSDIQPDPAQRCASVA